MRKPARLRSGDTVALLSPSAGLPGLFPRTFEDALLKPRVRAEMDGETRRLRLLEPAVL
jgi:hypothetical protein